MFMVLNVYTFYTVYVLWITIHFTQWFFRIVYVMMMEIVIQLINCVYLLINICITIALHFTEPTDSCKTLLN